MTAAHTPGPWTADPAGTIRAQFSAQPLPYPLAIALGDADVGKGRGEANARLIAAAPQLLSELQAAHALLRLALSYMPPDRAAMFAAESERQGLGVDGAIRHHERSLVLQVATGVRA